MITAKKFSFAIFFTILAGILFFSLRTQAAQLGVTIESTDGSACEALLDSDYRSIEDFTAGTMLTLHTEEPIDSLYIKWDSIPNAWTLSEGGTDSAHGQNGFLHEFIKLSGTSNSATITIPDGGAVLADVFAFSAGELPDFVQQWEPSWDKADILLISTHADDEVIFFGGVIPNYTNDNKARVQVAYFSDFFLTETYRNHELLDGLWAMGVNHYPQLGRFMDNYSESIEEAEAQFAEEDTLGYIVETIRRFKPLVLVSHDVNGEYGHGAHQLVSKRVREAVEITADASQYPESAAAYGTWDVPKTYLHLYPEKQVELKTRAPLTHFGGKTAITVAKEAYLKHQSQQWMDFIVDDGYDEAGNPNDYQYSNAIYGLYRTTVGDDFGDNELLDNLTTYDGVNYTKEEPETGEAPEPEKKETSGGSTLLIVLCCVVVLALLVVINILVSAARRKQRRRYRRRRR